MAGIGFELRRMMRKETLYSMVQTYAYAGSIGSGPWVISIAAILIIGIFVNANMAQGRFVEQFQVSISYLMACSLILTSPLQLLFTRFAADRIFEKRSHMVLPNLIGILTMTALASAIIAGPVLLYWFDGSFAYRICMFMSFVILSCIWIVQIFASAVHAPGLVLMVFALGYGITVAAALALSRFGLEGLLLGFISGQATLLFTLLALVVREYPAQQLVSFSFLRRDQIFPTLALTGLLYSLGAWVDKFIFWGDSLTGAQVIGPLRASPIYDLPIFLAYLSIIPGMAVFFVRMEVDVAEQCEKYFRTVTNGGSFGEVVEEKRKLVSAIKGGLLEMIKVQLVATLVLLVFGEQLLLLFGISPLYRSLLSVDLVAVAMQLVVLAILNFLFYLDRRKLVLGLCLLFFMSNTALSILSLNAGPLLYGYGFATAAFLTALVGAFCLSTTLDRLEYETFMLQPATIH
ncbi:MAG: exopolysaccharide Pel transporter PelG [Telluria sp.]